MVNDVIAATQGNVAEAGVASVDEVRAAGRTLGGFSPELAAKERDLKRFMYANLYHHPMQVAAADAAQQVISRLFAAYRSEEHTSELQSLMRISYAVFCLKKKT